MLVVVLLQVQALPVNLSDSYAILPVLKHIQPPLPTVYVLGTVLQVGPLPGLQAAHHHMKAFGKQCNPSCPGLC